jgi:hypothetical protein
MTVPGPQAAVYLSAGIMMLLFGRRLFWLFVAVLGFVTSVEVAPLILPGRPEWMIWLAALGVGAAGALLAMGLQYVAAGMAGFVIGANAVMVVLVQFSAEPARVLVLAGGIIGMVLAVAAFDWAIIALSSLAGAWLLLRPFTWQPAAHIALLLVLTAAGIAVQSAVLSRGAPPRRSPPGQG